jgi:hypothetical protein
VPELRNAWHSLSDPGHATGHSIQLSSSNQLQVITLADVVSLRLRNLTLSINPALSLSNLKHKE